MPGRCFEEEPEGAGQEAATACRARRISREHQFGGGRRHPQSAGRAEVGRRAVELGFSSTVGIIHDGDGQLQPLRKKSAKSTWRRRSSGAAATGSSIFSRTISRTAGRMSGDAARARATSTSARTAWCIIARSSAAIRPSRSIDYTVEDIRREFLTEKSCAPMCTVACVHYTSYMDFWRAPQTIAAAPRAAAAAAGDLSQNQVAVVQYSHVESPTMAGSDGRICRRAATPCRRAASSSFTTVVQAEVDRMFSHTRSEPERFAGHH